MKETHVNTVEAKNRLNELIAEANKTKKPIVVKKRNTPVAVVVDFATYQAERSSRKDDSSLLQELHAFHRMMKKKNPQGTGDSVQILREARDERHS